MKILYLCPSPHLGLGARCGWSTHMAAVIRALRGHGHSVQPFIANEGFPDPAPRSRSWLRRIAPAPVRLARRDLGDLIHDRRLDRRVLQVCREFRPDVIYERTEINHNVGARVARALGVPLVLEVNGPLVDERLAWAGLLCPGYTRRLEAAKYAAADSIVTVSAALRDDLAARGLDPARIHAIPNGVDPEVFHPDRADPEPLRARLGLDGHMVVGFVGAFADWHGLETLVAAAGEVARNGGVDLHLLMIGEGPSRPALCDLARRAGLEGRATLPGSVPHEQVPHYLAAMDLCVLPAANWYMSPIKLFEYGAMGRPVIAPRTPAVAEVMADGAEGLLVTPGCAAELTRAIRYLACHPRERAAMAAAFQRRVRQQHTWMQVAGRVSQLLEQSLQARQSSKASVRRRGEEAGSAAPSESTRS